MCPSRAREEGHSRAGACCRRWPRGLQEKRRELRSLVNQLAGKSASVEDDLAKPAAVKAAPKPPPKSPPKKREPSAIVQFLKGGFVKGVMRTFFLVSGGITGAVPFSQ